MKRLLAAITLIILTAVAPLAQDAGLTCEAGFKPVVHALGESCVPEKPARVVALDMTVIELLLAAGTPPVAGSELAFGAFTQMHPELGDTYAAVLANGTDVGYPPNIEAILQAAPDLIIGPKDFFTEAVYPELSAVIPMVLYDYTPSNWRERLVFAGDVLGLTALVDSMLADYDARIAEFRAVMPETEVPFELSIVRTFPGQIGLLLDGTAAAGLLAEAGIGRPESQRLDYDYVLTELDGRPELLISEEELQLADGDAIFFLGDASELAASDLWNLLPAVADGRAFEVGYYWWGDSLFSAHDMLDDLFAHVAGVTPENPNPFADGLPTPDTLAPEATPES